MSHNFMTYAAQSPQRGSHNAPVDRLQHFLVGEASPLFSFTVTK